MSLSADKYKDITVSRGYKYHYYVSSSQGSKPTLLFVHGFPSTSQDWHRIAPHFEQQGYGIVVPDTLAYGGTDKPTDPAAYKGTQLAKDLVDILDAEKIDKVVAVGHDWGSLIVSRLASVAPERIQAYAFFVVAYAAPNPDADFEKVLKFTKDTFGYELFGYQKFFASDDAAELIEKNWDTFFGLTWTADPILWKTHIAPTGAFRQALEAGEKRPLPYYLTEEDKKEMTKNVLAGGLAAPTCFYKVQLQGLAKEDDKSIPEDRRYPPTSSPIFFGAATEDYICIANMHKGLVTNPHFKDHDVTIHEYDGTHWIILSHAKKIKVDLGKWLENIAPKL